MKHPALSPGQTDDKPRLKKTGFISSLYWPGHLNVSGPIFMPLIKEVSSSRNCAVYSPDIYIQFS